MTEWLEHVQLGATSWTLPEELRGRGPQEWREVGIEVSHAEVIDRLTPSISESVVGIGANGACDRPPASPDTRAEVLHAIELAASCSIPLVYLPSFELGEPRSAQERIDLAGLLREAGREATRRNIEFAWETPFPAKDVADALRTVGVAVSYLPDLQNSHLWNIDLVSIWKLGIRFAPHCHIKDGTDGVYGNALIGHGEAKPLLTLRKLLKLGYRPSCLISENEYGTLGLNALHQDLTSIWKEVSESTQK